MLNHQKPQYSTSSLLLALMIVLVVNSAAASESKTGIEKSFITYSSAEYGFSLKIPRNSKIYPPTTTQSEIKISMGIRKLHEGYAELSSGEYFLDILVFDHKVGKKLQYSCEALLQNPIAQTKHGNKIYRGTPNDVSSDVGGRVNSLCVSAEPYDFYISGVEASSGNSILESVFDTFEINR